MPKGVYKRKPRTPEHCANLSKSFKNSDSVKAHNESMRGVPLPPEHIVALTGITHRNSDAVKAAYDVMCGGNDLVDHHYIYDHSDLSLNTVQMTRSDHQKLHLLLKRLGYIIPHINLSDKQDKQERKEISQPKGL